MATISSKYLKSLAASEGFDLCGATKCKRFPTNEASFFHWLESGYGSSLEYMHRNTDVRFDATLLVEGAKSVVMCAVSYKSEISGGYIPEQRCKIASYACNRDYHKSIKKMLLNMLKSLQEEYPNINGRTFVDSAPILEKQYAVEAGLGWIGRQSLLVTPDFGSYVLLGELVLDCEIDSYDEPLSVAGCGECNRCMEACPTGAIVAPMTINTSRCISCQTIEKPGETKPKLHGWIFGCDECQNCCPYNKKAKLHSNSAFNPLFDPRTISAQEWEAMSDEEFSTRFGTTPLKRSGLERIKTNLKRD